MTGPVQGHAGFEGSPYTEPFTWNEHTHPAHPYTHAETTLAAASSAPDERDNAVASAASSSPTSRDSGTTATEIVRRAERGIGLCIRKGQDEGRLPKAGGDCRTDLREDLVAMNNYVSKAEFYGNESTGRAGFRHLTDGVSDDRFESALTEAKSEGNLSRANVARKAAVRFAIARFRAWSMAEKPFSRSSLLTRYSLGASS